MHKKNNVEQTTSSALYSRANAYTCIYTKRLVLFYAPGCFYSFPRDDVFVVVARATLFQHFD